MKLHFRKIFVLALFVLLSGCAKHWIKSGLTPEQWKTDETDCREIAKKEVPPAMTYTQSPGYQAPSAVTCTRNSPACNTSVGMVRAPVLTKYDSNIGARDQAWEDCIRKRGYHLEGEESREAN